MNKLSEYLIEMRVNSHLMRALVELGNDLILERKKTGKPITAFDTALIDYSLAEAQKLLVRSQTISEQVSGGANGAR